MQPKLENALPPHPATLPRAKAVQPKLANPLPPHPATLPRARAVQLRAAAGGGAPHPATVQRASAVQRVAQRASVPVDLNALGRRITRYNARDMAGRCVESAQEVGKALGAARVGYVAAVYRDKTGQARNHIAAVARIEDREQVVDATWKQLPFLWNAQAKPSRVVDLKAEPTLLVCTVEEWTDRIVRYTPGIDQLLVERLNSADEATRWMRDRRADLPQTAPAPFTKKTHGCTLF